MKKSMFVIIFALILACFACYFLGHAIGLEYDPTSTYEAPVRVSEVDEATGWITLVDWNGEAWCIRGQDYEIDQLTIAVFNDNKTPDNIYDDLIVEVRCLVDIKDINE